LGVFCGFQLEICKKINCFVGTSKKALYFKLERKLVKFGLIPLYLGLYGNWGVPMSVAPLGHLREDVGAQVLGEANSQNLK
jgi:hypothetical protein